MNIKINEFIYVPVILTPCGTIESSISPGTKDGSNCFFENEKIAKEFLDAIMTHPSTNGGTGKLIKYKRMEE